MIALSIGVRCSRLLMERLDRPHYLSLTKMQDRVEIFYPLAAVSVHQPLKKSVLDTSTVNIHLNL